MKNILLILILLISGYAIGQTSTPIKTNYDFKKGFKVTGGNAVVPIATGDTYAVPLKQMQDTTLKYLQKKDTVSYVDIPEDNLVLLNMIQPDTMKAKVLPLFTYFGGSTNTLLDNQATASAAYVKETCIINYIGYSLSGTANFTGDNTNGIAIYKLTSGTTITKVAETNNNANILKTATATYARATFTAECTMEPGLYYIVILYNYSAQTTAPIWHSSTVSSGFTRQLLGLNKPLCWVKSGINSFPETIDLTTVSPANLILNFQLY